MKVRQILILIIIAVISYSCSSKKESAKSTGDQYARIMFYNVENLFDTIDTEGIRDIEFTPDGDKAWDTKKYEDKLVKLSRVIASADTGFFPDIIGLAEIENKDVVLDLIQTDLLQKQNYSIIHKNSPDNRGIDCGLAYTNAYSPISNQFILVDLEGNRSNTRDILYTKGTLYLDTVHVFVNHWPSRYGGKEKSDPKRAFTAQVLRNTIDSIQSADKNPKIIIMGDFNDYPPDSNLAYVLNAKPILADDANDLVNLAWGMNEAGLGSYNYKGSWGTLDQFIVSGTLFNDGILRVDQQSFNVVKKDWMLYTNKNGNQSPSRSYGGDNYYGGYSDHLPILLKLKIDK